jgi:hypothetical protein
MILDTGELLTVRKPTVKARLVAPRPGLLDAAV